MKTFFFTFIITFSIMFFQSCEKKEIHKRYIYIHEYFLFDEYGSNKNVIDSAGNIINNISIKIENTDFEAEYNIIYVSGIPMFQAGFIDIKLNKNKPYNIVYEGDNIGKFILYDQFFNDVSNDIPSVSLTEKSKANIEIEKTNCYMGLFLDYYEWEIDVLGKVNKTPDKPFRSFIIYFGNENVSNTNYYYSYTPKIRDKSIEPSDTRSLNYYDDGEFKLRFVVPRSNFTTTQIQDILENGFYAVAYGIAGGAVYDSIPKYDTYIDPITGLVVNPGLGEPSNIAIDTVFNDMIWRN